MSTTKFDAVKTDDPTAVNVYEFFVAGAQTTGTKKAAALVPLAGRVVAVRIHADTAPVGSSLIADVNKNGTTLFTTQANRPTIAASANAGSATLPDVLTVAAGDRISVDVDQIGSGTAGSDLYLSVAIAHPLTPR